MAFITLEVLIFSNPIISVTSEHPLNILSIEVIFWLNVNLLISITLFLNSYDNREKIAYKLIRQLEKIAMDYEFKSVVVKFDSKEDILVDIFEKLDYHFVDDSLMKKEFKSLI